MSLDETNAAFEALFDEVIIGPPLSEVIVGKPYVVITSGGVRLVGAAPISGSTDPDKALSMWLTHAKSYARVAGGKFLYWRTPLELGPITGMAGAFTAYARLLVSDRKFSDEELKAKAAAYNLVPDANGLLKIA